MKHHLSVLLANIFLQIFSTISAQPVSIGGIINTYSSITGIDTSGCNDVVSVNDASGFVVGDTVMIIQMKGATIDSSNTPSFGDVTDLGSAGNFEFTYVVSISGNQITMWGKLQNSYVPSGVVQLIRVPAFSDVDVTDTLLAKNWDGFTGGVLVFFVSDTLYMNSNIEASGKGFRGGTISNNPDGYCGNNNIGEYYYDVNQGGINWSAGGAEKGEGIVKISSTKLGGKGKLANGGGGGNKHNTGGGGGANYTFGGKGGNELEGCIINGNGGIGGTALPYNLGKVFLGGGGGCGDFNNGVGSVGVNGGGIIIIKAKYIVGNGHQIIADGLDEFIQGSGIADGVGGGGGGGAILLAIQNFTSSYLTLQANGGDGGDQGISNYWGCVGTGGGGGSGVIYISGSSLPANVTTETVPGAAGVILNSSFSCYNTTYGAVSGVSSPTSYLTGLSLPYSQSALSPVYIGIDTSICEGDSLILDAGNPGANFLWSNGYTTQSISVNAAGEYSVLVSLANCFVSDTIWITIVPCNPQSFVASDTSVCEKFCIDFYDSSQNNPVSWMWLFEGGIPGFSILQNPEMICYNLPGVYDVTFITIDANNVSDTAVLADYITVYPTPATPIISQSGNVLTSTPASFYQWQFNSIDIPGATSQSYTATQSGLYTVVISSETGCTSSASFNFLISGVEDYNESMFASIYPNPLKGIFNLEVVQRNSINLKISIENEFGQVLFSSEEKTLEKHFTKTIDLSFLPTGTYFMQVKSAQKTIRKKVIILR